MVLMLMASTANASENSVSVGEHTFTADLPDGWKAFDNLNIGPVNEEDAGIDDGYSWKGFGAVPWFYPQYPNAPKGDSDQLFSSVVNLYVFTIPADLKKDQLDENIRVYGSADKIPDDKKKKDIADLLMVLAPPYLNKQMMDYSNKDITFDDHPAHLAEMTTQNLDNNNEVSSGRIAILLDENTIGIIDVTVCHFSNSGTFFDSKAWDVINSITVN